MELQLPKGTKDFSPGEKIARDRIANTLKTTFELYGYSPLETPVFERYDVLSSKYAGGTEILKETFRFKDQGQRELALRYDLTVPLARYVGMNPGIKMPFKRYQIGEVFRDGPVASARYRQFTQCDVDVVGCKDLIADAEIIALANACFRKLEFDCTIKINNRKLINDILKFFGVPEDSFDAVILSLDKLEKFGSNAVREELGQKGIDPKISAKLLDLIGIREDNEEKARQIQNSIRKSEGLEEIKQLLTYLELMGINAEFDISLARGLSYYTGTVIEITLGNSSVKSSVAGGGRYDRMIGSFLGKGEVAAVGISFGLDRIYDAYIEKNELKEKTSAKVFIIPINTLGDSMAIAKKLRDNGINTDIDLMSRGPSKNLGYADSLGIPYAIFAGRDELDQNKVKLRDMKTGKEELLSVDETIKRLKY
ncbi:histidine--tRNA ligase [Candidatus Woesearchaeota archaeon]|nr:histidine--tRNA ligase [Candidatus Woesearchaeota archaeon]